MPHVFLMLSSSHSTYRHQEQSTKHEWGEQCANEKFMIAISYLKIMEMRERLTGIPFDIFEE